jgi:hypothetical protein
MDSLAAPTRGAQEKHAMAHAFRVGDRVVIAPDAYIRAGDSGVITVLVGDNAIVQFDDGAEFGYLIDDGELLLQETIMLGITIGQIADI